MLHRFPFPTHRQWRCPTHRLLREGNRSSHPQRCEPACRRSNSLSLESQEAAAGTTPLERSLQSLSHDERKQSLPPTMPDGRRVRFLKTCFEDVIRCPLLKRLYREFFAHTPGHEDERHLRASLLRNSQCGNAIETRKSVVRQDQLNSAPLKESEEVGLGFCTG